MDAETIVNTDDKSNVNMKATDTKEASAQIQLTDINAKSLSQINNVALPPPDPQIPNSPLLNNMDAELKQDHISQEISIDPSMDAIIDEKQCCACFNSDVFRAVMCTILFVILYFTYASDILSMFSLFYPTEGGGISGCICDKMNTMNHCHQCWNCMWPEADSSQCVNIDPKIDILQYIFPYFVGYCAIGWFLIEVTIWIRMCNICLMYDKEGFMYKEQIDKQSEEFQLENNSHVFPHLRLDIMSVQKQETLAQYGTAFDNDIKGLIPCCFEDIDRYHMKKVLMVNMEQDEVLLNERYEMTDDDEHKSCCAFPGEIGAKCCEFPCFMFGFSLSIWWLFPFRYFWIYSVWDLSSAFWKRICWHCVFHVICFDICWLLYCFFTYQLMNDAKQKEINNYVDRFAPFIHRKVISCLSMIVITIIVWLTVAIYALAKRYASDVDYAPIGPGSACI